MKRPSIQLSKFIITPVEPPGRVAARLQRDIRRQANLNLIRDVGIGVADGIKSIRLPKIPVRIKSYKPGWKDVIIAFLFGVVVALSHMVHAQTVGGVIPPQHTTKAVKTLKTPPIAIQAKAEPIYVAPVVVAPTPVVGCGSDTYMAFIYQHESGCNTGSINASSGACGLGQALPCSKMGCSLSDWNCQNNFFTNYAVSRYGSTYNAYLFWLSAHWW